MITGRPALPTDTCPHGQPLGDCTEAWCRARVDDLLNGDYEAKPLADPETVEEARDRRESVTFRPRVETLAGLSVHADAAPRWPAGAHGCARCGSWWTGQRACHCTACHQTFGGLTAFDDHRYGTHSPPRRSCRPTDWMRGKGWRLDDAAIWRLPAPPEQIEYQES